MAENNSNRKFEEALELLNEAAREKKEEIQNLIADKYSHIKEALQDSSESKLDSVKRLGKQAERAIEEGTEQVQDAVEDLEKQVRKNPWAYVGGAAFGALLLGFILGTSRKDDK